MVPHHYRIRLEPDLSAATFAGSEIVTVEVTEPTARLVLNTAELEIYEAHLRNEAGDHVEASVTYDEEAQRAILTLDEEVKPGSWELYCGFTGILNDQLHGFYRSTFTDVEGNEQAIATTQFEATDARRAFPCWDEPDFKAVYSVTLVVPEDLLAVSNSAEVERVPMGGGKVAITFADTMKMSTYLVAFVVGPFEATDAADVDGVPLRIIAPRGKKHLTDFAMKCGEFCLGYLAEYYGIPYPGDKVDMVAIPDFAFGAMENLGCITYRETALLVDEATATSGELLRILDVVAHELAHMWFGDLVTMKWWNGIWLNEAFATFMEMKATDARRPDWKRWLAFGAVERPWAFTVDDLATTRPVEFEVNSPEDANAMFDALTYGKGSAVLRMMEQYLGEEPFRLGVGNYLRTHAYGNTETADLWKGLNEASGEPVGDIMDTWILQGGYPQVEVTPTEGGIAISQSRFLMTPDPADLTQWKLPLQVRGMAGGSAFSSKLLLDGSSTVLVVDGSIDWVIANAGGHGFYRTWYDDSLFGALMDDIGALDALERYTLVDDAWAFVESGQARAASFLRVASAFENEREQAIWTALLTGASGIGHHLVSEADRPKYEQWVSDLVATQANELGWDAKPGEPDLIRRLRGQLLGAMGRMANHAGTIDRSRQVHEQLVGDPTSVDPRGRPGCPLHGGGTRGCGHLRGLPQPTPRRRDTSGVTQVPAGSGIVRRRGGGGSDLRAHRRRYGSQSRHDLGAGPNAHQPQIRSPRLGQPSCALGRHGRLDTADDPLLDARRAAGSLPTRGRSRCRSILCRNPPLNCSQGPRAEAGAITSHGGDERARVGRDLPGLQGVDTSKLRGGSGGHLILG